MEESCVRSDRPAKHLLILRMMQEDNPEEWRSLVFSQIVMTPPSEHLLLLLDGIARGKKIGLDASKMK